MSEQAERLRKAIKSRLTEITAPMESRYPTDVEVGEIVEIIVSEMGITEEMVAALAVARDQIPATSALNATWVSVHAAHAALSALMEVGNG